MKLIFSLVLLASIGLVLSETSDRLSIVQNEGGTGIFGRIFGSKRNLFEESDLENDTTEPEVIEPEVESGKKSGSVHFVKPTGCPTCNHVPIIDCSGGKKC